MSRRRSPSVDSEPQSTAIYELLTGLRADAMRVRQLRVEAVQAAEHMAGTELFTAMARYASALRRLDEWMRRPGIPDELRSIWATMPPMMPVGVDGRSGVPRPIQPESCDYFQDSPAIGTALAALLDRIDATLASAASVAEGTAAETIGPSKPEPSTGIDGADERENDGPQQDLLRFARTSLKGIERRVVELLVEHKGTISFADMACDAAIGWSVSRDAAIAWDATDDAACDDRFNSVRKRLNKKLRASGLPFHIDTKKDAFRRNAVLRPNPSPRPAGRQ